MKEFFGLVDTVAGGAGALIRFLVAGFFVALLAGYVLSRIPDRDPVTGGAAHHSSYVADIVFDIDQHYSWGVSGEQRPTLTGVVYADDLGATGGSGLSRCYTDYRHSHCEWHPRVRISDRTRFIRVRIYNQLNPVESVATVTIPIDSSMYDPHFLDSRAGSRLVRGGIFRYDADRNTFIR